MSGVGCVTSLLLDFILSKLSYLIATFVILLKNKWLSVDSDIQDFNISHHVLLLPTLFCLRFRIN